MGIKWMRQRPVHHTHKMKQIGNTMQNVPTYVYLQVITIPGMLESLILVLVLTGMVFTTVSEWWLICVFLEWEAKIAASDNALPNSSRSMSSPLSSSKSFHQPVVESETGVAGEEATSQEVVHDSSTLDDFCTRRARQLHEKRISWRKTTIWYSNYFTNIILTDTLSNIGLHFQLKAGNGVREFKKTYEKCSHILALHNQKQKEHALQSLNFCLKSEHKPGEK